VKSSRNGAFGFPVSRFLSARIILPETAPQGSQTNNGHLPVFA